MDLSNTLPAHWFATPFEGDYPSMARTLTEQSFNKMVEASDHLADRLHQPRLPVQAAPEIAGTVPFSGWRPEIGAAALGASRGIDLDSWSWFSAQMLLAATLKGRIQAFEGTFQGHYPLTVAGLLLPDGRYRIEAQDKTIRIRNLSTNQDHHFQCMNEGKGVPPWLECGRAPLRVGSAAYAAITTDAWMDFWFPDAERGDAILDPALPDRFERGMDLIEECSPHYYRWIALPLREVVPIRLRLRGTHSQSFAAWPGQVHVPVTTPLNLLVSLVHECSHQYYHMLQWHLRMVKPTAPEAYSALKKVQRPLEKLLKGFHAFGNVMLALQALEPLQDRFAQDDVAHASGTDMDRELQIIYRSSFREVVKANRDLIHGLDQELQAHYQSHFEAPGTSLYLALRARLLGAGLLSSATC